MKNDWNSVKPVGCKPWLVLPAVYSDALSYGDQIAHFCAALNKLIQNNNTLPEYIQQMIQDYINGDVIGEVVQNIISQFILNVKYPPENLKPAVGDGSADDTEAIQGCIDYVAENGGVVYFPYGSYLTQPLTMKDGVSLFGFDRYSTKIVLKGGATKPLISGTVSNISISNLTLDGNSGIQVNDVNVVTLMATNVLFTNLIIKDGYTLVNYVGTGGHFQISDVVFGNAVEKCLLTTGNADIQCENVMFNQLSAVGGISVMDIGTNNGYFNVKSIATCNQCIIINGNNNKISAIIENAITPITDNGEKNNIEVYGVSSQKFYSGNNTINIGGDCVEIIDGDYINTVNKNMTNTVKGECENIINGGMTNTVEGKCENNVNGDYEENVLQKYNLTCMTFNLNSTKPVEYNHEPVEVNNIYKTLDLVCNGKTEKVLLKNKILPDLTTINVKNYGAKGDGYTDDTVAIQTAIDENIPTDKSKILNGVSIFFPAGTYVISDTLELGAYITLVGEGHGQTILFMGNNVNKPLIKTKNYDTLAVQHNKNWFLSSDVPCSCGVKGMLLFGNVWNNTYDSLVKTYAYNMTFDDVYFYGYSGFGISMEWGDQSGEPEWVFNTDKISETTFNNCWFFGGTSAIYQSTRVNDVIYTNILVGRQEGICADIYGTAYMDDVHLYDCNRSGSSDYAVRLWNSGTYNLTVESMKSKPAINLAGSRMKVDIECYSNEDLDVQVSCFSSIIDARIYGNKEKTSALYMVKGASGNIVNATISGDYGETLIEGITNGILNILSTQVIKLGQGSAFTNVAGFAIGKSVEIGSGVDNVWYPGK